MGSLRNSPVGVSGVVFYINQEKHIFNASDDLTQSLNDYLRRKTRLKGTKLACGEGGCGACAVEITQHDPSIGKDRTTSINSCLCPVGCLDGASITTVEGIGNSKAGFHKVQEAYASHHASQCGYCTPGFVVATHAAIKRCVSQGKTPTIEALQQGLDGNLCRCTGYRPNLDACRSLADGHDLEDLCSIACAGKDCSGGTNCGGCIQDKLKLLSKGREPARGGKCFEAEGTPYKYWASPATLDDLLKDMAAHQDGSIRLVAGNTGPGIYKDWPSEDALLDVRHVKELITITQDKEGLKLGASTSIEQLIWALQGSHGRFHDAWRAAADHLLRIAGSHVRAAATLGGHLALMKERALQSNLVPALVALDAKVGITTLDGTKWLPPLEVLYGEADLGLGRTAVVSAIHIPPPSPGLWLKGHKVSKRYYNAHALVDVTLSVVFEPPLMEGKFPDGVHPLVKHPKIIVSVPTVIHKGAGGNCGPDKVEWRARRAECAEAALADRPLDVDSLVAALEQLPHDIEPGDTPDGGTAPYYQNTAEGLILQAFGPLLATANDCSPQLQRLLETASNLGPPGVAEGKQTYPDYSDLAPPLHAPIEKDRVRLQASGEAVYTSDHALGGDELYSYPVESSQALAILESVDASEALKAPGVVAFISAKDVPGENRVKGGASDAPLFAEDRVEYVGQHIGIIVAETPKQAQSAAALVSVRYGHPKELGDPILSIPDAIKADSYYDPPGSGSFTSGRVCIGDPDKALSTAPHTIKGGRYSLPSQQHFYMETQNALAEVGEGGTVTVHSSTQTLDGVQQAVARALGIKAHAVTVVCRRIGGAFGGKVSRSMPVAAAAAVAAHVTGRCVRYQLDRNADMRTNGGRSETMIEYDIGFDGDGKVHALKAYAFENLSLDLKLVRTNFPPRTIVRGPGFINSVMIIEQLMEHIASHLGADPVKVREVNFLKAYPFDAPTPLPNGARPSAAIAPPVASSGSTESGLASSNGAKHDTGTKQNGHVPGGCGRINGWASKQQKRLMRTSLGRVFEADLFTLPRIWKEIQESTDYRARQKDIAEFNKASAWRKRGMTITPCRFDCAPPPITAAVSIFFDGSVVLIPGGLEMGQGLHTKVKQIASYELGKLLPKDQRPLPMELLRIGDSRSDIVPNGGPSWSSTTSESTVAAVTEACRQLVANLEPWRQEGETAEETWCNTVGSVHTDVGYAPASAMLSAYGFYDGKTRGEGDSNKGSVGPARASVVAGSEPLAYCTFGAACSEVEVDALTGESRVLRCDILFDCGRSLNPAADMGQVEGAFIMGLGFFTSEEVMADSSTGKLLSDGTWEYKIPAATCIPRQFNATFIKDSPNERGIMGSKASGEPALLLSVSILHAMRMAVGAARAELAAKQANTLPRVITPAACTPGEEDQPQLAAHTSFSVKLKREDNGQEIMIPKAITGEWTDQLTLAALNVGRNNFVMLPGPATVVKLKEACGSFSAAAVLKEALQAERGSEASSPEGWVLLEQD
ncbi:molybdenum cofactor-binding domain-containing protein [Coccomyxa subellipsoidea C-169]|uniref:Molybdenum cofactor-binding domain-containing protein n=1 Tax=Coccomyxa subellipsoidea (strain C-169) TaxID=574566 RepID=I0YTM1_COCSC|nr:molybdenum cofactor-binding domain-containing protein [Coccomyxa subellipsoidea C-169]EIE21740.1 molybdenum cofactor-binding domain-containing protein [Coccomyxa subellipsoidea C-169]|eukprot:XP_005646284.1 molybdenum cofactor-binding domain-containing protein [Coccomyxa subellipsoidea C-169]